MANAEGGERGAGYYGALAWRVIKPVQVAARLGQLNTDTGNDKDRTTRIELGVTWSIMDTRAKLQVALSRRQYQDATHQPLTQVTLSTQAAF